MKSSLKQRAAVAFGFIGILIAGISIVSYQSTTKLSESAAWRSHSYQVLESIEKLVSFIKDAESGQRGFLMTGVDRYLDPYRAGTRQIDPALDALKRLTADNPSAQMHLSRMDVLIREKLVELKETIDLRTNVSLEAALKVVSTDRGKNTMEELREIASEMLTEEKALLKDRNQAVDESSKNVTRVTFLGALLALTSLLTIFWYTVKSVINPIENGVNVIAGASSEILASTNQVASGATETATAVNQTTITVEEVKQTAQMANQKAKHVSENSKKAVEVSRNGKKSVEDSIDGMNQIKRQMEMIAEGIVKLSDQSQAIGEIIGTVSDLAEQSNLLSVNAAIEAAKAGDHGRGFAVVAQEVKTLAEQSKQATVQVRTLLNDIQKATGAVVMSAEQGTKAVEQGMKQVTLSGDSIRNLSESISESAQAASQIAVSSEQQFQGVDQVASAMENIKKASAQNLSGIRQMEVAIQNLNNLGGSLRQMIGRS